MNEMETGRILAMVAVVDQMMPTDEEGFVHRAWCRLLHDVPVEAAEGAVTAYYRSDEYLRDRRPVSPAHIVQWWNARRRPTKQELRGTEVPREVGEVVAPVVPELIRSGVDRVMAALIGVKAVRAGEDRVMALAIGEGEAVVRREFRSRPCGHCGAAVGQGCTDAQGRPLRKSAAHDSRVRGVSPKSPRSDAAHVAPVQAVADSRDLSQD